MHEINKGAYKRKYMYLQSESQGDTMVGLNSTAQKLDSLDPILPYGTRQLLSYFIFFIT